MNRILALSKEKKLFSEIQTGLNKNIPLELITFPDTLNLIEKYVSIHIQLVILDIDLLNGQLVKLINILRSINKNVKIILISSKDKLPVCSKALSLGILSYLLKPVSVTSLTNLILSSMQSFSKKKSPSRSLESHE